MRWWALMPVRMLKDASVASRTSAPRGRDGREGQASERDGDDVMLIRPRKTRIVYGGNFRLSVELARHATK